MISFDNEKSMEDFIFGYYEDTGLFIADGEEYDICLKQYRLDEYGVSDLIFIKYSMCEEGELKEVIFNVVELKNEKIKIQDIGQVSRYRSAIETSFEKLGGYRPISVYQSLIVKPGVSEHSDVCYISNCIPELKIYEFTLDYRSGLKFELCGDFERTNANHELLADSLVGKIMEFVE